MRSFGFQWHITDRCNLACTHCYQSDFTGRRERNASDLRAMADRIFQSLPDRQISVNLTGGEPLLFPHLLDLIEHLHRFSNLQNVHIITNGTITKPSLLENIGRYPKVTRLKLSLEGGSSEVNDPVRGEGNLEKVRRNIGIYKKHTDISIAIMTTLAKYNVGDIANTVEFAHAEGADGIIFERFVPLGTGETISNQTLGPRGWKNAIRAIVAAAALPISPTSLLPYKAFWLWFGANGHHTLEGALCNLGDESMALMPNGEVFPCRRLPLSVGNVLSDSFGQILNRLAQFHPDQMQGCLNGNLCGMCGIESCAGCRALARALTQDVLADDPQCALHLP
ncbi:MAG: radical SAM protein [Proteobacteria bacterium]|nr:radical SAM protein [Pseudomonadota bacterium]